MSGLILGVLEKRYKRFLADIVLSDGSCCTVHCANPGAMTGLAEKGMEIFVAPKKNPKSKLPYRWVMSRVNHDTLVGVDTLRTNDIAYNGLSHQKIPRFADYPIIKREVSVGEGSRIDFCLSGHRDKPDYYLEVKSVTYSPSLGVAAFPDTQTKRGQKHLRVLQDLCSRGYRAGLLFVVQRSDCTGFKVAEEIDPDYARLLDQAREKGVTLDAWDCWLEPKLDQISLRAPLAYCG